MDFKLEQQLVVVTSVNPRTEAAGENKRANLGTDIWVTAEKLDASVLRILQPTDPGVDVDAQSAFFTKDGTPRFRSITTVGFDYQLKNCEVVIADQQFKQAKVNGISLVKCYDTGKVDIEFRIQLHPTGDQVGVLSAQLTKDNTVLSLSPAQQELPLEEADAA